MRAQKVLGLVCLVVLALPMLASAEIYKWKDKNGVMRYSDTPPSSKMKVDTLRGKSVSKPETKATPQGVNETAAPAESNPKIDKRFVDRPNPEADAKRLRARNAEAEKRNKEEEKRNAKLNIENCKAARANYANLKVGGRIYKTNENGDREYYGEDELNAQKATAQAEMRKYCN